MTARSFATTLEGALKTYARPPLRPPLRIFRDEKFIRPGDDLPSVIQSSLANSDFLILIASPSAATSPWVSNELEQWTTQLHRTHRLVIVLTEGEIAVNAFDQQIEWEATTALPNALSRSITSLPVWVDLRGTSEKDWTLQNLRFADAINAISATLRGVTPAEMNDRHVLEYRRGKRIRNAVVATITSLAIGLSAASTLLWRSRQEVVRQRNTSESRRLAALSTIERSSGRPDAATLLAAEALKFADTSESRSALFAAVQQYIGKEAIFRCPDCTITEMAFRETTEPLPRGLLAVGTSTGDIWLKDIKQSESLARASTGVHRAAINALTFNPGGTLLASSGVVADAQLALWKVEADATPHQLTLLQVLPGLALAAAFSPDGTRLASARRDGSIVLCSVSEEHLEIQNVWPAHRGPVLSVAFSPDGRHLASAGIDGQVRIWDALNGRPSGPTLRGSQALIGRLDFSPDGRLLAAAGHDGLIRLWDAVTGTPVGTALGGHRGLVASVSFSSDGAKLVSSGADGRVITWDTATQRPLGTPIQAHRGTAARALFLFGGHGQAGTAVLNDSLLASAGDDGLVSLWRLSGSGSLRVPLGGAESITELLAAARDRDLVALAGGRRIVLYDLRTSTQVGGRLEMNEAIGALAISADGERVAAADLGGKIAVWDTSNRAPIGESFSVQPFVHALAFRPDGRRLAVAGEDGVLEWDVVSGRAVAEPLDEHIGEVYSVLYSPDGRFLISGGRDAAIVIRDAATLKPRGDPLEGHSEGVTSLAIDPSSSVLLSGSYDGTVRRWRLSEGTSLGEPLRVLGAGIHAVCLSPDGRTLAVGSSDGTIAFWNITDLQLLGVPLRAHRADIASLAFSREGRSVLSASDDGPALRWTVDVDRWLAIASKTVARNLSRNEWSRFVGSDIPYRKTFDQWPDGR